MSFQQENIVRQQTTIVSTVETAEDQRPGNTEDTKKDMPWSFLIVMCVILVVCKLSFLQHTDSPQGENVVRKPILTKSPIVNAEKIDNSITMEEPIDMPTLPITVASPSKTTVEIKIIENDRVADMLSNVQWSYLTLILVLIPAFLIPAIVSFVEVCIQHKQFQNSVLGNKSIADCHGCAWKLLKKNWCDDGIYALAIATFVIDIILNFFMSENANVVEFLKTSGVGMASIVIVIFMHISAHGHCFSKTQDKIAFREDWREIAFCRFCHSTFGMMSAHRQKDLIEGKKVPFTAEDNIFDMSGHTRKVVVGICNLLTVSNYCLNSVLFKKEAETEEEEMINEEVKDRRTLKQIIKLILTGILFALIFISIIPYVLMLRVTIFDGQYHSYSEVFFGGLVGLFTTFIGNFVIEKILNLVM